MDTKTIKRLIEEKLTDNLAKIAFAKKVIGYFCFLNSLTIEKMSLKKSNKSLLRSQINFSERCEAFKIFDNKEITYWFYYPRRNIINKHNEYGIKIGTAELEYYYINFNEKLLILFIYSSSNNLLNKSELNLLNSETSLSKIGFNFKFYNFILGAGVSIPYGIIGWDDIIKECKKAFESLTFHSSDNIIRASYNTTYGSCQLLKDTYPEEYYSIIESSVLSSSLQQQSKCKTTLEAITNIIFKQNTLNKQQVVFTFNYDELLEKLIRKIPLDYDQIYKGKKHASSNVDVVIIHSHGLIPGKECLKLKKYKDSLVFSNDEYNTAYKYSHSFSYEQLKTQLVKTNIFVGNSISDYEEQKIIKNLHDDNLSKFHLALMIKNPDYYVNVYNAIRLMKIGVICIFFDTPDQMANFIDNLLP